MKGISQQYILMIFIALKISVVMTILMSDMRQFFNLFFISHERLNKTVTVNKSVNNCYLNLL